MGSVGRADDEDVVSATFFWRGKRRRNAPRLQVIKRQQPRTVWVAPAVYELVSTFARSQGITIRAAADAILAPSRAVTSVSLRSGSQERGEPKTRSQRKPGRLGGMT